MKIFSYRFLLVIITLAVLLSSCAEVQPSQTEATDDSSTDTAQEDTVTEKTDTPDIPNGESYGYSLVFSDEFDGSSLDTDVWKYRVDEKGGGINKKENVSVHDGRLYIKFQKENGKYTGGGIISKELFGYGYYETKCTLFAEGGGLHSAFWLMGGSGDGQSLPKENLVFEIDGFEFDSNKPCELQYNINYKVGKSYGLIHKQSVTSLSKREFVIGFEWLADRVNWYLDGELVYTVTDKEEPLYYAQQAVWLTALANTTLSGSINDAQLPTYTSFDYFRYYALPQKDVNLVGASEFEYNSNIDFVSTVNMQNPISFCESGNVECSYIKKCDDAYGGNCVLVHANSKKTAYSVKTYQTLYSIPNGTYTFSCMMKKTGNFEQISLEALSGGEVIKAEMVTDKVGNEWGRITVDDVQIKENQVTLYISSKSDGTGELYIDNVSFTANEGKSANQALHYPCRVREGQQIGEVLLDTKSSAFSTSAGWKKSSVIGANYASMYKLSATDGDFAKWKFKPSVNSSFELSIYNIESNSKIQKQKLCVYEGGVLIASFNCGAKAGWEVLGEVALKAGTEYELKLENTAGNRTMRVDSVRLSPTGSPLYADCIIMNTNVSKAYVYGCMTAANTAPSPTIISDKLYLPKDWMQDKLGSVIDGETTDVGGTVYVSADGLPSSVGVYCDSASGTVVIYPSEKCPDGKITAAAAELF